MSKRSRRRRNKSTTPATKAAPEQGPRLVSLNAAYDLADQNPEINEQFGRAKHASGRMSLNPADRGVMIDRSRYEIFEANPWLKGSSRATTVSVIGRGPEIEVPEAEGITEAEAKLVESEFNKWLRKRKTGRKFRAMANAKQSDGAGMAIAFSNPKAGEDEVSLDFAPFDVDHIRPPIYPAPMDTREHCLSGKEIDASGEAVWYWITPEHPAENPTTQPRKVSARYVLDVWDWQRPSQSLGAPEYATTIRNGPIARSYRRATIDSAALASKHAGVMETNVDRFETGEMALSPMAAWVQVGTPYGTMSALPYGWKLNQLKSENPHTKHSEFIRDLAAEHGRGVNQPNFIALGDGADQNFSSMAGLRQEWELEVDAQRQDWETEALDKLLALWLEEMVALGKLPTKFRNVEAVGHTWRWRKRRHQDTDKEYNGRKTAVVSGLRSRRNWQTDDGLDPEQEDEQAAAGFGITKQEYRRILLISNFGDAARNVLGIATQTDVQLAAAKANAGKAAKDETK